MKELLYKYFSTENAKLFDELRSQSLLTENAVYNLIAHDCNKNINDTGKHKIDKDKMISIIIPTYNRKEKLFECVNSILTQTYQNFEILIVDDGSTDNTKDYILENIKDHRVLFFTNKNNSGAGFSRKFGYNESKGDYIIFMDDDDYYIDDNYFENAVSFFEDSNIDILCSNSFVKYEKENLYSFKSLNIVDNISCYEYLKKFMIYYDKPNSTFSAIFRKNSLENAKFNDVDMVNDASIYMRGLLNTGNVKFYENVIGVYRIHDKNITNNISPEFLIDNLEEKYKVFKIIKNKYSNKVTKNWINAQISLTLKYYINGTNPKKTEINKVYNWIKNREICSYLIVFKLKIYYVLFKLNKSIKNCFNKIRG